MILPVENVYCTQPRDDNLRKTLSYGIGLASNFSVSHQMRLARSVVKLRDGYSSSRATSLVNQFNIFNLIDGDVIHLLFICGT